MERPKGVPEVAAIGRHYIHQPIWSKTMVAEVITMERLASAVVELRSLAHLGSCLPHTTVSLMMIFLEDS